MAATEGNACVSKSPTRQTAEGETLQNSPDHAGQLLTQHTANEGNEGEAGKGEVAPTTRGVSIFFSGLLGVPAVDVHTKVLQAPERKRASRRNGKGGG